MYSNLKSFQKRGTTRKKNTLADPQNFKSVEIVFVIWILYLS